MFLEVFGALKFPQECNVKNTCAASLFPPSESWKIRNKNTTENHTFPSSTHTHCLDTPAFCCALDTLCILKIGLFPVATSLQVTWRFQLDSKDEASPYTPPASWSNAVLFVDAPAGPVGPVQAWQWQIDPFPPRSITPVFSFFWGGGKKQCHLRLKSLTLRELSQLFPSHQPPQRLPSRGAPGPPGHRKAEALHGAPGASGSQVLRAKSWETGLPTGAHFMPLHGPGKWTSSF